MAVLSEAEGLAGDMGGVEELRSGIRLLGGGHSILPLVAGVMISVLSGVRGVGQI